MAPHDPREREVVAWAGGWQVRQFPRVDPKLAYFAERGFLHLQLWSACDHTSILTPSRLTAGRFDGWIAGGPRFVVSSWGELADALAGRRVIAPPASEVRALERWLVMRDEPAHLRLLRTWWSAATR
jgi:hypothetical protein